MRKPPMSSPGCAFRCHCGLSCCTCKVHCNRSYCNKKSWDETKKRNDRIRVLAIRIKSDRSELAALKKQEARQ